MKKHFFSLLAALSMFAVLALPASAEISLSAGGSSMSDDRQTVTLELTFTCAFTGDYYIGGQLLQVSGRLQNSGYSQGVSGSCEEGDEVTDSIELISYNGMAFKPGPAQLRADLYLSSYDPGTGEYQQDSGLLQTVVRLRK